MDMEEGDVGRAVLGDVLGDGDLMGESLGDESDVSMDMEEGDVGRAVLGDVLGDGDLMG